MRHVGQAAAPPLQVLVDALDDAALRLPQRVVRVLQLKRGQRCVLHEGEQIRDKHRHRLVVGDDVVQVERKDRRAIVRHVKAA